MHINLSIPLTSEKTGNWQETLPYIIKPFDGESLYGYILRLDKANRYTPGTVLDMIKNGNKDRQTFKCPSIFILNDLFRIDKLAELVNLQEDSLDLLTMPFILRYIFGTKSAYSYFRCYSQYFKLCPVCIREGNMPMFFNFDRVSLCLEHKLFLSDKCNCGCRVQLFSYSSEVYHCPQCGTPYSESSKFKVNASDPEYKKVKHLFILYSKLIEDYKALKTKDPHQMDKLLQRIFDFIDPIK